MKVTDEARAGAGEWVVINCPATIVLSRRPTDAEAQERAAWYGGASFVYRLSTKERLALDELHPSSPVT